MAQKKFKDLNLNDAFLFAAALQDEETCKMILEMILGRKIPQIKVHVEHSLMFSSDFRSIRLDVYASDRMKVDYNLEMQNSDKKQLPKRSRFHQAEIDVSALKPGEEFIDLKPSYVIFICTFDPFDKKLYRYTFEERCLERDFALGDGSCKIFLSTKGKNAEEVPKELVNFLHYVEHSNDTYVAQVQDEKIEKLHEKIRQLKESRAWRERYMTFGQMLDDVRKESEKRGERRGEKLGEKRGVRRGRRQGKRLGEKQGIKRLLELMNRMTQAGEAEAITRLQKDEAFLQEMFRKYKV